MGEVDGGHSGQAGDRSDTGPEGHFFLKLLLARGTRSRLISLLLGAVLLLVLIWYSVYSIGDRPWEVEEILAHPGEYEEEEVVFSHTIREFETGDVMEVAFSRDDMRLWVPLEFNHEPELEVGGVLTLKGVCRIQSRGVIVVLDYHVADTGFKVVLGGLGLVIMIGYFLRRYRLNTGQVSWERREDA